MFNRKPKQSDKKTDLSDLQAPTTDPRFNQALRVYFERLGDPIVSRARYWVALIMVGAVALIEAFVLLNLFPLKQGVPYVVTKTEAGEVLSVDPTGAKQFVPGRAEVKFFLGRWVKNLISLDAKLTEANLREAWIFVLAKAQSEFSDYIRKNQPLAQVKRNPELSRTVKIVSITFPVDEVANVRIETEERNGQEMPIKKAHTIVIHYRVRPPETQEEIYTNPLGLYITHFDITEEVR